MLLIIISAGVFACGRGGNVTLTGKFENTPAHELTADEAVALLENSSDRISAVNKIKQEANARFVWADFWIKLSSKPAMVASLDEKESRELFGLHASSCSGSGFEAFARFVLSVQNGYEYVAGEKRNCNVALQGDVVSGLLKILHEKSKTEKSHALLMARLVVFETRTALDHNSKKMFESIPLSGWARVSDSLCENNACHPVLFELLDVHRKISGNTLALVPRVFLNSLAGPENLRQTIRLAGYANTLRIIDERIALMIRHNERAGSDYMKLLEVLEGYFEESAEPGWFDSWNHFNIMLSIAKGVQRHSKKKLDFTRLLEWREKLERKLERSFVGDFNKSVEFLEAYSTQSLEALWLRYRLGDDFRRISGVFSENYGFIPDDKLEKALYYRLKTRLGVDKQELQKNIKEFCNMLSSSGVREIRLSPDKIAGFFKNDFSPGCYYVKAHGQTFVVEQDLIKMPFDSVVIAPEANIMIKAAVFDGSFFDLSSDREHPPLEQEKNPAGRPDALMIPVVLGYRVDSPVGLYGNGVHYFVVHLALRQAVPGTGSTVAPQRGFAGGAFGAEVKDDKKSFRPVVLGLGGPGQKGAPVIKGGASSESRISIPRAVKLFRNFDLDGRKAGAGERPYFLFNPAPHYIQEIREKAARLQNGVVKKYFLNPTELIGIAIDQEDKIKEACLGYETLSRCFEEYLSYEADKKVAGLLLAHSDSDLSVEPLPEFDTSSCSAAFAANGPVNPDGPAGADGFIGFKGFGKGDW